MVATAQSVEERGVDGLVASGFPEKGIRSQRIVDTTWQFDVTKDGQALPISVGITCDATVVDVPEVNGKFLVSVWHCFAEDIISEEVTKSLMEQYSSPQIDVSGANIEYIKIGDIIIKRDNFGMAVFGDPDFNFNGPDGLAVIFLPNSSLDPDAAASLELGAMTLDDLWFEEIPEDARFFEICTPGDTSLKPVVMENGVLNPNKEQTETTIYASPILAGMGCSGAGITMVTEDGDEHLVAVHVGGNRKDRIDGKTAVGYKLSGLGSRGFFQLLTQAIVDSQ